MKLIARREQQAQQGFLRDHNGVKFILSCRVEFAPEELDQIKWYKVENWPVIYSPPDNRDGRQPTTTTMAELMTGMSFESDDVTVLLRIIEDFKKACECFKALLYVATTFQGEQVVEF